jgi:uncharacterized iron-regulated protein
MHARAAVIPLLLCTLLAACVVRAPAPSAAPAMAISDATGMPDAADLGRRLQALLPTDVLLIGEQHDAPSHQQLQAVVVQTLAADGRLAAVALEMADRGASTAGLAPQATEAQVQAALQWSDAAWPWAAYGPVVMTAVRAGVPVLGANLPRGQMKNAMFNIALDDHLTLGLWQKQQDIIREGHCDLLPVSQIIPMTRIQTARDAAMAQTVTAARQPSKTVLLVAGNGHVDRELGVPTHLGRDVTARALVLSPARSPGGGTASPAADAVWHTPPPPPKDYCADLRQQMAPGR